MDKPVICVATFRPKANEAKNVRHAMERAVAQVHHEPGCLVYALHESEDGRLVFIEKWETQNALNRHLKGAAVLDLLAAVEGKLEQPIEGMLLEAIPGGFDDRGRI